MVAFSVLHMHTSEKQRRPSSLQHMEIAGRGVHMVRSQGSDSPTLLFSGSYDAAAFVSVLPAADGKLCEAEESYQV